MLPEGSVIFDDVSSIIYNGRITVLSGTVLMQRIEYYLVYLARKSPTKDGRQERNEIDSDSMGTIEALIKG